MFRYERLSGEIESKIKDGTYEVGEKLPSVRALSRSLNLSLTTVLSAYRSLEDQEIIQAKSKSGFFVLPNRSISSKEITLAKLTPPQEIPFSGLMQDLLAENGQPDLIRLSLAQPEPESLPGDALNRTIRRVLRNPHLRTSDYIDPKGLLSFRAKIAALMLERGVNISASEILVTNGCQQALRIALECVIEEGEIIAVETPCYPGLLHIASLLGAKVLEIPSRGDTGIDLNLLSEALDTYKIKVIFLSPTCSNPNGSTVPVENRKAVVKMAKNHQTFIIEDDTNRDLFFRGSPPPSIKSFDQEDTVIFCGSFSKTLGPGMRLGWMIPGRFLDQALAKRYTDDLGGPSIEQHVLAEFIATRPYYKALEKARCIHARTVVNMAQEIRKIFPKGTEVAIPTGGFLLWVKLPETINGNNFRKAALEKNISIAPGSIFSEIEGVDNYVRIGWGGKWNEKVEKVIGTLGEIARGMI